MKVRVETSITKQTWPLCHVMHVTMHFRTRRLFYLLFTASSIFIVCLALHISNNNKDTFPALSLYTESSSFRKEKSGLGWFSLISLPWEVHRTVSVSNYQQLASQALGSVFQEMNLGLDVYKSSLFVVDDPCRCKACVCLCSGGRARLQLGCSSWPGPRHRNAVCAIWTVTCLSARPQGLEGRKLLHVYIAELSIAPLIPSFSV